MKKINFQVNKKDEFELFIADGVFTPTATTNYLIDSVIDYRDSINRTESVLDLGCGCGPVGISVYKKLNVKNLYASDFSKEAVSVTKENFNLHKVNGIVKQGSLLDPWEGHKFDIIIDDISGISTTVASLTSWFDGVPCESGEDGAKLTIEVLRNSKKYLKPGGLLFFPIISFSNVKKIDEEAKKLFTKVNLLSNNTWPFPDELMKHTKILANLKEKDLITYEDKFGIRLAFTKIMVAQND